MANIIVKSEERRAREERVRQSYGVDRHDSAGMEACEAIAARTNEALEQGRLQGGRKSWS